MSYSRYPLVLTMGLSRGWLFIFVIMAFTTLNSRNVDGRAHFHKKKNNNAKKGRPVSPSSPASPPPTVPSAPSDSRVFDVTSFGAVGDGSTDDTAAFTAAWKAACAVESAVLLAPADYEFTITSTIFSGPCKPGLVFQVNCELIVLLLSFVYVVKIWYW